MSQSAQPSVTRQDFDQYLVPTYAPADIVPVKGEGLRVTDQEGQHYLDFTSGIGVLSLGHCPPAVVEALTRQAGLLWHIGNGYTNEPVIKLAQALTEKTFADRAFFANSGAEANEAAFKLARKWGNPRGKNRILSCVQSFHGRTLFTVTVGGQPKYTQGFEPLPPAIDHFTFNDLGSAKAAMGPDVCAVVVEPVQGEGGVIPADPAFLEGLAQLCRDNDALLIFDEIQCGMGRTGNLYAYEGYGVTPDILTTAKALGNGFPVGAMLTTEALANVFTVGDHGTTYGGNPLAAAVALEVVNTISNPEFLKQVQNNSHYLHQQLNALQAKYPDIIQTVRGKGFMLGLVLTAAYAGKAKQLSLLTQKHQLLTLIAGPDVLRLLPPLVASPAEIDQAITQLDKALAELHSQPA